MSFHCSPAIPHPVETLVHEPWSLAIKPFQVSPHTWYVAGQTWVGCYLIDTGDGLILISHAHFDHCGAAAEMKKLTGASMYMSKEDYVFMKSCPEETMIPDSGSHVQDFEPDEFYSDDKPVTLGNISVQTMLTPGHTIGCTSFFWKEKNPVNGDEYTVAMHGGVGANTMNDKYYAISKYLTPDLRQRFFDDTEKLKKIHVDIALPSHPNQIEIVDRAGQYTHENQPYLDDTVWADFLTERVRQVRELIKYQKTEGVLP